MGKGVFRGKRWLFIVIPLALVLIIAGVLVASILIRQNKPAAIKIASVSHKTEYYVGESLDTSALTVALYSETKLLRYLGADEYRVENFDSSEAGEIVLRIVYDGMETNYTVTVKERPAETPSYASLEVYKLPAKTQYRVGESLDVSGGILQINYTNGTFERVELLPLMTSGFSSETPGTVSVRVDYVGMVTHFTVEVVAS